MSTVFPFGAARCIDCKAPVAIVRRTVEFACPDGNVSDCGREDCRCGDCMRHGFPFRDAFPCRCHTHAIPDIALTVVDAEGERHLCASNG